MTAAKVLGVVARLPDCDGQAADAVSACPVAKKRTIPDCSTLFDQKVQILGYVFHLGFCGTAQRSIT